MDGFYEQFCAACVKKGTTLTTVLRKIDRATGTIGGWKKGQSPRLDITVEIADYLGISIDELARGDVSNFRRVSDDEKEWLSLISRIEPSRLELCKDFLKTHIVEPEKYEGKRKTS